MNISAVFALKTAVGNTSLHKGNPLVPSVSTGMFNDIQSIGVNIPQAGTIKLGIYDLTGKSVVNVLNAYRTAGISFIRVDRVSPLTSPDPCYLLLIFHCIQYLLYIIQIINCFIHPRFTPEKVTAGFCAQKVPVRILNSRFKTCFNGIISRIQKRMK